MSTPRDPHPYCPSYCEENVWHLAGEPGFDRGDVVFVSNAGRCVPIWSQRAAPDPSAPVVWDYHVILVVAGSDGAQVYDLDTRLGWPVAFDHYIERSFGPGLGLRAELVPRFRVVDALSFRARFSSDRSHMRRDDGGWNAPPPPWPPIQAGGESTNLWRFVDLERPFEGQVVDLAGLRARFSAL